MIDRISTVLETQLKTLEAFSPYGTFHIALANTLNWWFNNKFLVNQFAISNGIFQVGEVVTPFVSKVIPVTTKITFDPLILKILMTGEDALERLFEHIGTQIALYLNMWTGIPKLDASGTGLYPGILTTFPVVFSVGHFKDIGKKHKMEISLIEPNDENVFFLIWEKFEDNLKLAINSIGPVNMAVTGFAPLTVAVYNYTMNGGPYTGNTTIKLIA